MTSCQTVSYRVYFGFLPLLSCRVSRLDINPSHEAGFQQCHKQSEWYRNDGSVINNGDNEEGSGFCRVKDGSGLPVFFLLFCISVYVSSKTGQKENMLTYQWVVSSL